MYAVACYACVGVYAVDGLVVRSEVRSRYRVPPVALDAVAGIFGAQVRSRSLPAADRRVALVHVDYGRWNLVEGDGHLVVVGAGVLVLVDLQVRMVGLRPAEGGRSVCRVVAGGVRVVAVGKGGGAAAAGGPRAYYAVALLVRADGVELEVKSADGGVAARAGVRDLHELDAHGVRVEAGAGKAHVVDFPEIEGVDAVVADAYVLGNAVLACKPAYLCVRVGHAALVNPPASRRRVVVGGLQVPYAVEVAGVAADAAVLACIRCRLLEEGDVHGVYRDARRVACNEVDVDVAVPRDMDRRVKRERRGGLRGVGEGAGYLLAHPHVGRVALGGRRVGAQLHRPAAYGDMVAGGSALVHAYYRHLAEDYVLFGLAYAARVVDARVVDGLRPLEDVFDLGLVVRYRYGYEAVRIVVAAGRLRAVVVVVDDGRKPVSVHVVGRPPALVGRVGVVYLQLCSVSADGVDVGRCRWCRYVDERYSHVVAAGALAVALGEGKHVGAAAVGVGRRLYRVGRGHDYARACPLQRGAFDGGDRRVGAGYLSGDAADGDVGARLGRRYLAEVVDCGGRTVAFCIHKVPCIGYASVVAREYPRVVHYVGRVLYRRVAVVGDALGRCGCPVAVHAVRNCRSVELNYEAAGFTAYYCRYRSFLPHQRDCLRYRAAAVAPRVEALAPAGYSYYVVLHVVPAVEGAE